MQYMFLLYVDPAASPEYGTPAFDDMVTEYQRADAAMREAGVLVADSRLAPESTATTVRVRGFETQLTDGPFAEIKEMLGGYYVIECEDLDAAVKWASSIPASAHGAIEIRPLLQTDGAPR